MIIQGKAWSIVILVMKEPVWYTVHEADALSEKNTRSSMIIFFVALTNLKNPPPFSLVLTCFPIETRYTRWVRETSNARPTQTCIAMLVKLGISQYEITQTTKSDPIASDENDISTAMRWYIVSQRCHYQQQESPLPI